MPTRRRWTSNTEDGRGRRCGHHRGPVHVSGADGGGHPRLQCAPGAGGARPDPAHRDGARHRAALQPHLRARFLRAARGADRGAGGDACRASTAARCPRATTTPSRCSPAARKAAARGDHAHRHRLAHARRAEGSGQLGAVHPVSRVRQRDARPQAFRQALEEGIGWGDAKQVLFERIETDVAPMRERYEALMAIRPDRGDPAARAREGACHRHAASGRACAMRWACARARRSRRCGAADEGRAKGRQDCRASPVSAMPRASSASGCSPPMARSCCCRCRLTIPRQPARCRSDQGLGATAAVMQMTETGMQLEIDGKAVASTPDYVDEPARDRR